MSTNTQLTYYQKNRYVILSKAKDYYENNKNKLSKQARDNYNDLPKEEKNKKENIEEIVTTICLKKKKIKKENMKKIGITLC